jgi:phosphoribosylformimino-5-aminoimidazole carboxamide ribotide isomerase
MEIIPVLDVARGKVVRGVKGDRAAYREIASPLAKSADPADVAQGLMRLFPFRRLYMADLDGIEGRGRNVHLVPSISAALPACEIWIDAGTASRNAARSVLAAPVTTLVVGSESIETAGEIADILAEAPARSVLSLDFRGEEFMGPPEILKNAALWPSRVIVMTLARVGSGEGPDLSRIREIVSRAEGRKIYAAGGVRARSDIEDARRAGAAGVLIATALHEGTLSAKDLKDIAGRK